MEHRPQLDGLRLVAFLAVYLFHFDPNAFGFGAIGVKLFFALSGFLIVRILIRNEGPSLADNLRVFYLRRTLRIFPLYYAYLFTLLAAGRLEGAKWQILYLTNIYGFAKQRWPYFLGHFWTLAVEEQFYVCFPVALYLTPKRWRLAMIAAAFVGGELCRFGLVAYTTRRFTGQLPMVAGLTLLMGCAAGIWELARPAGTKWAPGPGLFWAGCGVLAFVWIGQKVTGPRHIYYDLGGVGCTLVVLGAWTSTGVIASALSWEPAVYLGRISYGLYVLHIPALALTTGIWGVTWRAVIAGMALTIIAAMASWHFFESPILSLKSRFPYGPTKHGEEELSHGSIAIATADAG